MSKAEVDTKQLHIRLSSSMAGKDLEKLAENWSKILEDNKMFVAREVDGGAVILEVVDKTKEI